MKPFIVVLLSNRALFFGKVHIPTISQNGSSWIKKIFWLLKDLLMIDHVL